ncbi:palmitoyl-acyl carrier protein thioesterase, chloroplastic-like [Cynara cardunculus var. scolymus]|uniref:palmitoyl-acyl carrier protein thioesterase, chloroplastic-like n=1 Tax=Cynara cardunculus var. scolymus TaxID=59895 RepID=UPI000D62F04D|nr:palmitoyl-acyl carrier protein thioesterase, chloroplastic-like [Cynara cardunculus var. scolymus]
MNIFSLSLKTTSLITTSQADDHDHDCRRIISGSFYKITGAKIGRTTTMAIASVAGVHVNGKVMGERTIIPTQKQFVDPFRQGVIILDGVGYRQTVVVRSYEVGTDKTATPQSLLNLLQETALNHVWMSGLLGDGFGATHGMMKNDLIWVVSRMQLQVDQYPIWGEILEIDTWVGASGKNGMRRDWEIRSHATGIVFARATSTWVMMNQKTRRLSKMPDEVRAEISPWFIKKQAIKEDCPEKIEKLDNNARYVNSGLQPKRSDLDMNKHVNNVKYLGWMLEAIPDECLESYQLSDITLEYRRECGSSDVVQSLCEPEETGMIKDGVQDTKLMDRCSMGGGIIQGNGLLNCLMNEGSTVRYTHLIQAKEESKCQEIVRGKTIWKKRINLLSFSG